MLWETFWCQVIRDFIDGDLEIHHKSGKVTRGPLKSIKVVDNEVTFSRRWCAQEVAEDTWRKCNDRPCTMKIEGLDPKKVGPHNDNAFMVAPDIGTFSFFPKDGSHLLEKDVKEFERALTA